MYKAKWRDSDSAIRLVSKFNNGEYSGTVLRLLEVIATALFHIINVGGGKLLAIKLVRSLAVAMEHPSLGGLKEAKDLVETECISYEEEEEDTVPRAHFLHSQQQIDNWRQSSFSYMDQVQATENELREVQGEREVLKSRLEDMTLMRDNMIQKATDYRIKMEALESYLGIKNTSVD